MQIQSSQMIFILIGSYFIVKSTLKFFRKETRQTAVKYLTTVFVWLCIIVIPMFPIQTQNMLNSIGLHNQSDILYILIFLVFILLFKIISIIEGLEKKITEIVRYDALKEFFKK